MNESRSFVFVKKTDSLCGVTMSVSLIRSGFDRGGPSSVPVFGLISRTPTDQGGHRIIGPSGAG
jgi:hypothetical protein